MKFMVFALFAASGLSFSSAFAQPGPFTNRLTANITSELGAPVAISGDTVVAFGYEAFSYKAEVFVFQRSPGGWHAGTSTATLTPSDGPPSYGSFGESLAISGDTIFVGSSGKIYIFVKPATGWQNMHETAQLTVANGEFTYFGGTLALDGDTLVALAKGSTAYVYLKPASGWAATSAYQATLTLPSGNGVDGVAVSGDTVVLGSYSSAAGEPSRSAYVFQKPGDGWAGTPPPLATLTRSTAEPSSDFGLNLAISGDTIAISDLYATVRNKQLGAVDLFVKSASGWADATETVELVGPPSQHTESSFGYALAMDSSHLLVASGSNTVFVYSKPAGGWGTFEWPSQEIVGVAGSGFGAAVSLDEDTTAIGAPTEITDVYNDRDGAAYVYTLEPNPILVSTTFMEFPDTNLGSTEKLSLTVTNSGTTTLTFTASMDAVNFQVLETEENTCSGGIPAGQSCVLPIEFNAPAPGVHTNHLILASAASGALRIVELRGTAGGIGAANEGTLQFGTEIGRSETLPLVLANFSVPGSPTVAVSLPDPSFSVASVGTCGAGVPEGGTCTMSIKFTPTQNADITGFITLTPSSGSAASKLPVLGVGGN